MFNGQLTMHTMSCSLLILLLISTAVKTASITSACTSPVSVGVVMTTRCRSVYALYNIVLCYIHSFSSFLFPAYFSDLLLNHMPLSVMFIERKFQGVKVPESESFMELSFLGRKFLLPCDSGHDHFSKNF